MNSDNICRLCLDISPVVHSIFKENVHSMIETLTSLNISEADTLPNGACAKCIINVFFAHNMRKRIIEANTKLINLYSTEGNFDKLLQNDKELKDVGKENSFNEVSVSDFDNPNTVLIKNENPSHDSDSENSAEELAKDDGKNERINDDFDEETSEIIFRKSQNKPYMYHCKVCKVDFTGSKLYNMHKGKHLKKTCKVCGITVRKDNFRKHELQHILGQQICDICGTVHKSFESLRTHMFHFHNSNKKLYKCEDCNLTFKYSHRLTHHKRKIHTGYRPHQCETCGKGFFDLATMRKHVNLVHLKLRSYLCKYCNKGYSSRYALKVHTRQHTDETPYVCEICTEGFRQSVSLRTHLKSKHNIIVSTEQQSSTSQNDEKV